MIDIVHDPEFRYVASIGGDVHNCRRYHADLEGRTIQHLVSEVAAPSMHETHLIPRIDPTSTFGVTEDELCCHPLRRDSLAAYSRVVQGILAKMHSAHESPDDVQRGGGSALVSCFGVTGCGTVEGAPPVEDQFELTW